MSDSDFYIKTLTATLLLIGTGFGIRTYLKKTGIDSPKFLVVGVFWLNFYANAAILIGAALLLIIAITFYFQLQYEGYI